jgi:hypothetical protein
MTAHLLAQFVTGSKLTELDEVHHVQCRDVVVLACQMILPPRLLPKPEALGVRIWVGMAHRGVLSDDAATDC